MHRQSFRVWFLVVCVLGLTLLAAGCAGDAAGTAAPAPQQPAPAVQPAPAAPAPEPLAAPVPAAPTARAPAAAPQPAPATKVEQPKYGGILRRGHRAAVPGPFESMRNFQRDLHDVAGTFYGNGNLVKRCRENVFRVCPGLAESWEANSDSTQWTFKIRQSVRWHDGTAFSVEDAKFWVDLAFSGAKSGDKTRRPAHFKADLGDLKSVEILPGNRLRLTLGTPNPQYLIVISEPRYNVAHPKHLLQPRIELGEVDVSPLDVGIVGTGPFKFLGHEKGTRVRVRRSDFYWEQDSQGRKLPFLDGIDFAIIPDPTAYDAAFRVGHLDAGIHGTEHNLTEERQARYIKDLGDTVWFTEVPYYFVPVGFNTLKPGPLQDVRVRRALQLWIDKAAAIPAVLGNKGVVFGIFPPGNPYTSPDLMTWPGWNPKTREQDRAEAKRLLAQAGYAGGFKLTHPCRRQWTNWCEFLSGQLPGLGIELKLELVDPTQHFEANLRLDHDIYLGGWSSTVVPEVAEFALNRQSITTRSNAKHEDPKIAEFFQQLKTTPNEQQRIRLFREMERYILVEQAYLIPTFGIIAVTPYRTYVKGLIVPAEDPNNNTDYATVWLDK